LGGVVKLDCRGDVCPVPVIRTKEALEAMEEGILDVELDNRASIENVKRFAKRMGYYFEVRSHGPAEATITVVKGYECGLDLPGEAAKRADDVARRTREWKREHKTVWALLIGGVVSAFLASTCCLGPLLFLLFGVSAGSLGFLDRLAPYHAYFALVAVAVVAWLWIDAIRGVRQPACETVLCRYYKGFLAAGTLLVLVFVTYPWWVGWLIERMDG